MASTSFIPNQITNANTNTCDSSKRRKRKKFQKHSNNNKSNCGINNHQSNQNIYPSWKSETQHQIYSSKLLQALRQVQANRSNNDKQQPRQDRAIREAADRMLAVTAKGRTRWSRAILKNKLKLKFIKRNKRQRGLIATATGNSRVKKPKVSILRLKTKNLPSIQRKARVLGGLVPGCKKQSLPVVLEEATDYIPALEMQVKAMAALVELLSGGSSSSVGAAGAGILGHLSLNRPSPNS